MCTRFVLSLPSSVACGKNTALFLNEGILSGEESGDDVGVLFLCGVSGEGGGEPHAPVCLCTAVAIACAIGMGWDFVVDFVVCDVVDLSVLEVLEVPVGTDIRCFCLRLCISQNFFALAGKASISCSNVQLVTYIYGLPVWSNIDIQQSGLL